MLDSIRFLNLLELPDPCFRRNDVLKDPEFFTELL